MVPKEVAGLLTLIILALLKGLVSGMDEETCQSMGFFPDKLMCSTCEEMLKFDLEKVREVCIQCCQEDEERQTVKYTKAILEVCK